MSKQEIFNRACNAYNHAITLVEEMTKIYNRLPDNDVSTNDAKAAFDLMLQGILLKVSMADSVLDYSELQFVNKITDNADILSFIKLSFDNGRPITWENLSTLNVNSFKAFADSIDIEINKAVEALVRIFVVADAFTDFDYLKTFTTDIVDIGIFLSTIDGNNSEDEKTVLLDSIHNTFYAIWDTALKKYRAG